MAKPIATILREVLTEAGVWKPGWSKTYQDTNYTRTKANKRWKSTDFWGRINECEATKQKIAALCKDEGHEVEAIYIYPTEVLVYQKPTIRP